MEKIIRSEGNTNSDGEPVIHCPDTDNAHHRIVSCDNCSHCTSYSLVDGWVRCNFEGNVEKQALDKEAHYEAIRKAAREGQTICYINPDDPYTSHLCSITGGTNERIDNFMFDDKLIYTIGAVIDMDQAIGSVYKSDGSTASYYEIPVGATELQHLIAYKDMNAQVGEIFRECYRYGEASHSDKLRGAKKMKFYAEAEIERLQKYEQ